MTDKEKFKQVCDEIGLKCRVTNDGIEIDSFEVDGGTNELFIKFYENGKYQEIVCYPKE